MPRLSVIIPAYNAADTLRRAADSVLSGSFADLELIIVDDGSKDATPDLCAELTQADGRVRVIRQENSGVSAARNRGVDEATGEYIAFVDADDLVEKSAYADMFEVLDKYKCQSAVCGYYEDWPDGTRIAKRAPAHSGALDFEDVRRRVVLPLLSDRLSEDLLLGTVWRYLFRTDVIREGNIRFSGAYLEDEVFLIEYFSHPGRLAVVDKPLYGYLQNPNSVTKRYLPGFTDTFLRTLELKAELVRRFEIPAPPDWRLNSAWAGLLIAVSNEFAPGAPAGGGERVKKLARLPLFAEALADYKPEGMNRNKTLVAFLLRRRMFGLLAALYTFKNSRRG
ncbi:MAG: glycosyltransferase family 2 protein [Candidatus Heteroscillospira sp.]|jgi:glycosyltransferase EpsJ